MTLISSWQQLRQNCDVSHGLSGLCSIWRQNM
jgi:hypothetical protein